MAMIRTERSEQSDSAQVITYLVSELEVMRARLDALEAKVEELGRDSGN
jgi:hypothetical protein